MSSKIYIRQYIFYPCHLKRSPMTQRIIAKKHPMVTSDHYYPSFVKTAVKTVACCLVADFTQFISPSKTLSISCKLAFYGRMIFADNPKRIKVIKDLQKSKLLLMIQFNHCFKVERNYVIIETGSHCNSHLLTFKASSIQK